MYEELVKRLRERAKRENDYYEHGGDVISEAADAIEELSKPRWIPVTERKTCYDTNESRVFRCSECGYGVDDIFEDKDAPLYLFERFEYWHFCPNCGVQIVEDHTNADR